ncbi:MAG: response regulator [Janthinobacterium lividum]
MGIILIVDDECVIAELLAYGLEDEGYTVIKAHNAKEGLKLLARDKPDLVITDFMMPGMNGAEFACSIRAIPGFEMLPIVLMTGGHRALADGSPELFYKVITKPFDLRNMLTLVAEILGLPSTPED